jgi:hypothetical protein
MAVQMLDKGDQYILNYCTKYLARDNTDPRHNYNNQFAPDDPRSRIAETWHFPLVDSYSDGLSVVESYRFNEVTFIYADLDRPQPQTVAVVGTFANLYEAIPLKAVKFLGEETGYYALTVVVPKGELHTYRFIVDGQSILDPFNPQRTLLDNGVTWSRFFTHLCTEMVSLEAWEAQILDRLTDHILPFRTEEGQRFLDFYYNFLDRQSKETKYLRAYRFDQSVGVVNFIDKLLAKEENHHLNDYKICLDIINRLLRQRNSFIEPEKMSKEMYIELYNQMASGTVPGWNYSRYSNPRYFLQILRRHTYTGAFSHPKYGGNVGATGWAYLASRYPFNWQQSLELPLGTNPDYRG